MAWVEQQRERRRVKRDFRELMMEEEDEDDGDVEEDEEDRYSRYQILLLHTSGHHSHISLLTLLLKRGALSRFSSIMRIIP